MCLASSNIAYLKVPNFKKKCITWAVQYFLGHLIAYLKVLLYK